MIATAKAGRGPIVAGCDDWARRFRTVDDAERWIADIEAAGHCQLPHGIIEVGG